MEGLKVPITEIQPVFNDAEDLTNENYLRDNNFAETVLDESQPHAEAVLGVVVEKLFYSQIFEDVRRQFPDKNIGTRSVMTATSDVSIEEVRYGPEMVRVRCWQEICETGREKGEKEDDILVATAGPVENFNKMPLRTDQYLSKIIMSFFRENPDEPSLCPAILIYDMDKLEHNGSGYHYKLPEEPSEALLAIYPINIRPLLFPEKKNEKARKSLWQRLTKKEK